MDAKFDLLQRGQYTYVQGNSQLAAVDSRTPFGLLEARNAVQIAKAAGAEQYASDSFHKAFQLLQQAEGSLARKGDKKQIEMSAREAVQTAEDARAITVKRREDERLTQERAAAAEREAKAKAQAAAAERATLQAQQTADRAAREKAEAEAARAAALVQQQAPRPPPSRPPATGLRQKQRAHPPWPSAGGAGRRWTRQSRERPKQKPPARPPRPTRKKRARPRASRE